MKKYRASKLTIKTVSKEKEKEFLNKYHYQGFIGSSWCKGLYKEDELICLMSFGTPRYNKAFNWELLRLCTKEDCQVYGGASKLLQNFREENPGPIISYCNETKFTGKVYEALGFSKSHVTKGYHYEKDGLTYHRSTFTKRNCLKRWPQYLNKDIGEWKIMEEQGYERVPEIQATWVLDDPVQYFVYEVTIQGFHYIGQHCYRTEKVKEGYTGSGTILKRMQRRYNETGNLKILVDSITSKSLINDLETHAIALSRQIYGRVDEGGRNINIQNGGYRCYDSYTRTYRQGKKGTPHTEEWKQSMSERMKVIKAETSKETRERMSEAAKETFRNGRIAYFKGKHHTEEAKEKNRQAHLGKTAWNKGKECTYKDKVSSTVLKTISKRTEEEKISISERIKKSQQEKYAQQTIEFNRQGWLIKEQILAIHGNLKDYEIVKRVGNLRAYKHK